MNKVSSETASRLQSAGSKSLLKLEFALWELLRFDSTSEPAFPYSPVGVLVTVADMRPSAPGQMIAFVPLIRVRAGTPALVPIAKCITRETAKLAGPWVNLQACGNIGSAGRVPHWLWGLYHRRIDGDRLVTRAVSEFMPFDDFVLFSLNAHKEIAAFCNSPEGREATRRENASHSPARASRGAPAGLATTKRKPSRRRPASATA